MKPITSIKKEITRPRHLIRTLAHIIAGNWGNRPLVNTKTGQEGKRLLRASPEQYAQLIQLWEASVRSSHEFLTEKDISDYRLLIHDYYLGQVELYYLWDGNQILGFIGMLKCHVQLLFVDPSHTGNGIGTLLMEFAINRHRASSVEVNEQNPRALAFYLKLGFEVVDRHPLDAAGKPYPVLSMQLSVE